MAFGSLGGIVNKATGIANKLPGVNPGMSVANKIPGGALGKAGGFALGGGVGGLLGGLLGGGGGTMVAPGGGGAPGAGGGDPFNLQNFITEMPQYKFLQGEGIRGLERSAAAKGGFGSGGLMKDLVSFSSGLASQSYDKEMNRIMEMAGVGAGSPGAAGQTYSQAATEGTEYGVQGQLGLGNIFSLFQ